ncbi:MAG: hypothetical protein IJE07_08680 [Clostridia bacterium]|nr:hypothetical protein [Clostridia bacterium]
MKRFVLFVGGGGARAAEALLVAACAGVLRADMLQVLLADTDHHGLRSAELLRAKYADYARMQAALQQQTAEAETAPFRTMVNFASWPEKLPGGATTLAAWTADAEADALLCQAFFGQEAAQQDLRGGFQGNRALGQTVFAGLLHSAAQDPQDVLARMIARMNEAIDAGEEVRVVLCGSVTGGTGAAGLPLLARHVQQQTAGRARIGAVLLAATGDHEDPAKARETLADFAGEKACSAVCVLGLPRSSCSDAPADCAHLTDWLAVYSMDVLLHRPAWPEGVFTVQTDAGALKWDIFGKAAARYRLAYGRLMKAAAAWNHVVAPMVERRLRHPFILRDGLFGWYAHFFRRAMGQRSECLEDVARLSRLMRVVLIWLGGLMQTLPPEMTHWDVLGPRQEEAQAYYSELVDLVGQLTMLDEESQQAEAFEENRVYRHRDDEQGEAQAALRRMDAVRREIDSRREAQERHSRIIGGAATIRLLQHAMADAQQDRQALQQRYEEAVRRIDHAESIAAPQDMYRITDARTKLERMAKHQRMLEAREAFVQEDVDAAGQDEARYAKPEITGAGAGNGLFDARLTRRLLLEERRVRPAEVEKAWPDMVHPADGRTLKETLRRSRKAPVADRAPVMSLLYALINGAMEEV